MLEEIDMKPPRFVRSLTAEERRQIEELFRRGFNGRVRRRAQAVRLSVMGYSVPRIVEILGCNRQSVHNWLNGFEAGGCEALFDKPRSGRPAMATVDYRWRLVRAVKYLKGASLANYDFGQAATLREAIIGTFEELNASTETELTLRFRDPLSKHLLQVA